MARAGESDGIGAAAEPAESADGLSKSRQSVSLAKTMRPGLLGVVRRSKLFERIDRGAERGIVWVAGPPGAGKTTLVSSYIEHRRLDHLWYQVDKGDVDAATFFHYLGLAASREASVDRHELPAFSASRASDAEAFSRTYFRELYRRLAPPFALVFDNYQEAPFHSPLHLIVNTALEEIPRSGFVVVISRYEPPQALARLRANQRIELIGWSDLALSPGELKSMARKRGQSLTDDASRSLFHRTQGWAAGAVLMLEHAKVMGTDADPPSDETPQVLFDYMAGEIFDGFEPSSQAFLLSTACLSQMTPETAEKISGYSKAGLLLANLARNDYFVAERIADGERVYQFHRLLSVFLRGRARQTYASSDWSRLVRRSGRLLAESGQVDDAIALLLDECQWDDAMALILANAAELLIQGRTETLMGWLDELPASTTADNAWYSYWQAAVRIGSAPRAARRYFERAFDGFRETSAADGMALAVCGIIDAIVRELDDFSLLDPWICAMEDVWRKHRDTIHGHVEHRVVHCMIVSQLLRRPGHADYHSWLDRGIELGRRNPGESLSSGLLPVLAIAHMWSGNYAQATDLLDSARAESESGILRADAAMQLGLVDALQRLLEGNPREEENSATCPIDDPGLDDPPPILRAVSCLNEGDIDSATALLDGLSTSPAPLRRLERGMHCYVRAWLGTLRDDRLHAYQMAQNALGIATEIGAPAFEIVCRLVLAETLAMCGDLRKASSHLELANDRLRSIGNPLLELMAGLSRARIALDSSQRDDAIDALKTALPIGRRYGFTRTLWWRPESMAGLCAVALEHGVEVDYVKHLIRCRGLLPDESTTDLQSWPWRFHVFTLGKFRLVKEGETQRPVKKSSRRPLELLKVLVALGGRDVKVEHVADIMWPNVDGDYSYGSLTSALHRLRRLLELDDAVLLEDGRLSLNSRYFWIDTWAIERVFAATDRIGDKPDLGKSMQAIVGRLLELYRGAFLEDEFESTCYFALREHLRGRVLRLLTKIAAQASQPSQIESAIDNFERAIDADPLCESFYRNLMMLYGRLERRSEAIDVYERCRTILTSTLKVPPSTETIALFEKLSHENSMPG